MFTGLIEETGALRSIQRGAHSAVLTIGAGRVLEGLKIGDSIAVNGVCLTVTDFSSSGFSADVMHETLSLIHISHLLVYELKQIGLQDAQVNHHGIVYTKLPPSSACTHCTAIGFLGHLDTYPGVPGKNVRPQIIPHYDGKDIRLGQSDVRCV